jgi:hypothetical protein
MFLLFATILSRDTTHQRPSGLQLIIAVSLPPLANLLNIRPTKISITSLILTHIILSV